MLVKQNYTAKNLCNECIMYSMSHFNVRAFITHYHKEDDASLALFRGGEQMFIYWGTLDDAVDRVDDYLKTMYN